MENGKNETEVGCDRVLPSEHQFDLALDRLVSTVDLVVERDDLVAQLHVLRAERVRDTADRPHDDLAGFLEARLESVELPLQLDPHPNRPVT